MKKFTTNKLISILWAVLSFSSLFIFFYVFHPQIILDFDDWSCITTLRLPLPLLNYWNPSRVLSELLYPMTGFVSGLLTKLIPSISIIRAVSLVTGILLTAIVFIYEYLFMSLLHKRFYISLINAELLSCVFIVIHFLFFRSNPEANFHFFRSTNITCCYYYLIPAIINCCMVMYLLISDVHSLPKTRKIIFYIALYLTIFSNLFASIILLCYAFVMFVKNTIDYTKDRYPFKLYLHNNSTYIIIGIMFIISLIADGLGGRGRHSSSSGTTIDIALLGYPPVKLILMQVSIFLITLVVISIVLYFILKRNNKLSKIQNSIIIYFIFSDILVFILTMLLCARVNPTYILRTEVLFGTGFFIIAEIVFVLALTFKDFKYNSYAIICVFSIFFLLSNTSGKTFLDSYCEMIDSELCYSISESLVSQVKDSVKNEEYDIKVYVLESFSDPEGNWPQHFMLGQYLPKMLKLFWVIDKPVTVEIVPDSNINNYYGVANW